MDPAYFVWTPDADKVTGGWFAHDLFNFFPNDEALRAAWEDWCEQPAPKDRVELYDSFKYVLG